MNAGGLAEQAGNHHRPVFAKFRKAVGTFILIRHMWETPR